MARKKKEEPAVSEVQNEVKKKAFMPIDEIIGHKDGEIFGIKVKDLSPDEIKRLEKGLLTDKTYNITLPSGESKVAKIQLSKTLNKEGIIPQYKPQYEKPYIPLKTFDNYQFSNEEKDNLLKGENVLYITKTASGNQLTKLAKLDLKKSDYDVNFTNQLIIADITRLPIEKISYGQKFDNEQLANFLNGKGVEIVNPKIGNNQHKGTMKIYFDPIKGTSRFQADQTLKESFKINQFQKESIKLKSPKPAL